MGVYHLMGLGCSPGTVIGPLTYLAHRYQRWNPEDQAFFARSGEVRQRQAGQKVGDIQAIVLFTTREILTGEVLARDYTENLPGTTKGPSKKGRAMKEVLRELLREEWPKISGGRQHGDLFWCEVNRRDIRTTYARVVEVVAALAGVGGQGKEIWINLTGGNNVINLALELAATLSGDVARLYYVQAENESAERCVRYTAEDGYWVELPVIPLAFGRLRQAIIDVLSEEGSLSLKDLYSRLRQGYWDLSRGLDSEEKLRNEHLAPLWKQGIIVESEPNIYRLGPQWELVRLYQETLQQARGRQRTIEQLCRMENWIEHEVLQF